VTVVVTGASGFIARHLIRSLLTRGREVIALTRDRRRVEPQSHLRIVETDYRSIDLPAASTVVHLAALRNAPGKRAADMNAVNVELVRRLGNAALAQGAARFIHIGSAVALGSSRLPIEDVTTLTDSTDPYVDSRGAGIHALEAIKGLPYVVLLPAIVYGPDHPQARNRITSHIRRLLSRPWRIAIGGSSAPRNLVLVDDVIRAIERAESGPSRRRELVAGENVTQDELEQLVFSAARRKPTPRIVIPRPAADLAARALDAVQRREQGWTRSIETLLTPWCFQPSPGHTLLRDGIAATVRSL
jgi:nucleoside-diphosphate-sugar epimerase